MIIGSRRCIFRSRSIQSFFFVCGGRKCCSPRALWLCLQVLKPLTEHYMEDNVRQTVVNSLKASLTEPGGGGGSSSLASSSSSSQQQQRQNAKLKTHWCTSLLTITLPRALTTVRSRSTPKLAVAFCPQKKQKPKSSLKMDANTLPWKHNYSQAGLLETTWKANASIVRSCRLR